MTHELDQPFKDPAIYEYREAIEHGIERFAKFGFAVLELEGPQIRVRYITEDGSENYKETIA